MKILKGIPFVLALCSASAAAQWRCDCTTITATCSATVTLEANFIDIRADRQQCARVDYFVDGLPFVSVVVDGQAREDWISRSANPRVIVQGCQVCRDIASAARPTANIPVSADAVAVPAQPTTSQAFVPLVAPQPAYPQSAETRGIEGYVTLEFTVNPFGDVASPRVVVAEPRGVFDLAALSAVSRWRYPSDAGREPVTLRETVRFDLSDFIWRTPAGVAQAAAVSAPPQSGPLNQCLRQNVSYNYGEMVEVALIDACASPLIVFACAVGTGAMAQRWVCHDSESQSSVLVPPGDARIGAPLAVEMGSVQRQFRFADRFFVARAPNSEYWWVACGISDLTCREDARRWSAGLDRQTASLDPSQRTRIDLGRSY